MLNQFRWATTSLALTSFVIILSTSCGDPGADRPPVSNIPQKVKGDDYFTSHWASAEGGFLTDGYRPIVYLDYIPTTPGRVAIAGGCVDALADDFELGFFVCPGSAERQPLVARQVEQRCASNESFETIAAQEMHQLPECSDWVLVAHTFDPPLRFAYGLPQRP